MTHSTDIELTTLHFDLCHTCRDLDYQLHLSGKRYPLTPHDDVSRQAACTENPALAAMAPERLTEVTHYVIDVPLPSTLARMVYVTQRGLDLAVNELPADTA